MNRPVSIQQAFQIAVQQHQEGRLSEAESLYRQIVGAQPGHADAFHMLGIVLSQLGRKVEAIEAFGIAISLNPNAPDFRANLAAALAAQQQVDAAVREFRAALAMKPDWPEVINNLAKALKSQGNFDDAIATFRQAIKVRPTLADSHVNLGDALLDVGKLDDAIACYRRAMTVNTDSRFASRLVYALHLHPDATPKRLYEAALRWTQTRTETITVQVPIHRNDPTPTRRLRIGYVSGDFREHEQACRILPLLANRDRAAFEVFCYSNQREPNTVTEKFLAQVDGWRDIAMITDAQAAELVTADKIDILVDLDSHGPQNRLTLFMRKPTPIQVTGFAYPGTSGLETVDYRITDARLEAPSSNGAFYCESPIILNRSAFCVDRPPVDVAIGALPATRNGFITFGWAGDYARVTRTTLDLWAGVLGKIDRSRMIIATPHGTAREQLLADLGARGIAAEGIELRDPLSTGERLTFWNAIDICLDTAPWNSALTSIDALWMGVPVVTLAGQTGVSIIGRSLLASAGLGDFAAETPEQFVHIASDAAGDIGRLTKMRSKLRAQIDASPLMDAKGFTRDVESAFKRTWQTWCEAQRGIGVARASAG